jgi:hypothetical protein
MIRTISAFLAILLFVTVVVGATPERPKGISIHMLPKRVAELSGRKWGLAVDYAAHLKPEPTQPVIQTVDEFSSYVRKQDAAVQENGVWIVTSHPDAYSETELALLDSIKSRCKSERVPLFIGRASELPNGWHRIDQ